MKNTLFMKNDLVELSIEDMTKDGEGIGHANGYTLFVKDAVVGDRILARVTKAGKSYGYARIQEIREPSPHRVPAPCPLARRCGGCTLQALSYPAQLSFKENLVRRNLERIGGFTDVPMEPILGMENPWRYRNKAQYPVGVVEEKAETAGRGAKPGEAGHRAKPGEAGHRAKPVEAGHRAKPGEAGHRAKPVEVCRSAKPGEACRIPKADAARASLAAGYYAARSHDLLDLRDCLLSPAHNAEILEAVLAFAEEYGVTAYDETTGKGLLRHILIREGFATGEILLCLVVNGRTLPHADELVRRVLGVFAKENAVAAGGGEESAKEAFADAEATVPGAFADAEATVPGAFADAETTVPGAFADAEATVPGAFAVPQHPAPQVRSICLNVNTRRTNVILGDEVIPLYGNPWITDRLGEFEFRISPLSFYQVNPVETLRLYETAVEYAGLTGTEIVFDLFCGIGTISHFLAKKAREVYGVEIVPQAIRDAAENAARNHLTNVRFFAAAAEEVAARGYFDEKTPLVRPDVVVLDPPRKGCEESLLRTIRALAPDRIVYVSCDSATLARDLRLLTAPEAAGEAAYRLTRVRPCDMFPGTGHVETVVLMSRI